MCISISYVFAYIYIYILHNVYYLIHIYSYAVYLDEQPPTYM